MSCQSTRYTYAYSAVWANALQLKPDNPKAEYSDKLKPALSSHEENYCTHPHIK